MTMNTFDEIEESIVETSFGRKRRRNKGNWKREVGKRCRSSGGGKIPGIWCHHNSTNSRALMLTFDDLANISTNVYPSNDRVKQDATLLSFMKILTCKRVRVNEDKRKKSR